MSPWWILGGLGAWLLLEQDKSKAGAKPKEAGPVPTGAGGTGYDGAETPMGTTGYEGAETPMGEEGNHDVDEDGPASATSASGDLDLLDSPAYLEHQTHPDDGFGGGGGGRTGGAGAGGSV